MRRLLEVALGSCSIFSCIAVWLYTTLYIADAISHVKSPDTIMLLGMSLYMIIGGWVIATVSARIIDALYPPEDDEITGEEL
jgi:hypothetical protein